jgi:rhamnogalacturonan endolyase
MRALMRRGGGDATRSRLRCDGRRLALERLESRQMMALTHLYTFNDGTANDSEGSAHGTLFNGAMIDDGRLVLLNSGITSGQTTAVKYAQLPANVLPSSGSFTIEVWFASNDAANWSRVFDIGDQTGTNGNSYVFFTPRSSSGDSRGVIHPAGSAERVVTSTATNNASEHMAAMVVDAGADQLRLYIDGSLKGTAALNGASAASVNDTLAYLGRSLFSADPGFTGWINEFRIYDEALTAEAVAQNAVAGPAVGAEPTLRQVELLDRGVVAIRRTSTQAYIGWRLLGTDPSDIAFNVYRTAGSGTPVKLNSTPITATTDYVDSTANFTVANSYQVRAVINGIEQPESKSFRLAANVSVNYFLEVPLQVPVGGTTPSGEAYTYTANDASVGDLDGDGEYEIILKWDPTNAKDSAQGGYTGNVYMDAYKLNGTRLWQIDLGRNIRAGAHYTQFVVYDLDGDGRAEVSMKTAPGTVDGVGNFVLMGSDSAAADYRNSSGYILTGPEYLTVFNGQTGANMATVAYQPARGSVSQWGDGYGNRVDRFAGAVAYLDGVRPSLVMSRGYYGPQSGGGQARNEIAAYDFRNGQLTLRWHFKAGLNINGNINSNYIGQGTHGISIADVDGDGKDEIVYGASVINDNGAPLYTTGWGHGDALHVSDMDPTRPGLEIFMPHEGTGGNGHVAASYRDAATGEMLFELPLAEQYFDEEDNEWKWPDVGRGVAMDIDPNHLGYEMWDSYHGSMYNIDGTAIYGKGNAFTNFGAWWDADLQRELLDGTTISNWNPGRSNIDLDPNSSNSTFAPGVTSNNGSKSTPALSGDILGDWREEVIWRTTDNTKLRIFTTPTPATSRMVTLMHDTQYRSAISWQNAAYNQPPHPSFYLGAGMAAPPTPPIYSVVNGDFDGSGTVDGADLDVWRTNAGQTGQYGQAVGDADADRDSDGFDFLVWQRNLGKGAPLPASTASVTTTLAAAIVAAEESPLTVLASSESVVAADESVASLAGAGLPEINGSEAKRATAQDVLARSSDRPVFGAVTAAIHVGSEDLTKRPNRRCVHGDGTSQAIDIVHELNADRHTVASSLDDAFASL